MKDGPSITVRFKLVALLELFGDGSTPCSLPISCWTINLKIYIGLVTIDWANLPAMTHTLENPIQCRLFTELQLPAGATSPPRDWWWSCCRGLGGGYISWRRLNASCRVGGRSAHPTVKLFSRCMRLYLYENCGNWITHLEFLQHWEAALNTATLLQPARQSTLTGRRRPTPVSAELTRELISAWTETSQTHLWKTRVAYGKSHMACE